MAYNIEDREEELAAREASWQAYSTIKPSPKVIAAIENIKNPEVRWTSWREAAASAPQNSPASAHHYWKAAELRYQLTIANTSGGELPQERIKNDLQAYAGSVIYALEAEVLSLDECDKILMELSSTPGSKQLVKERVVYVIEKIWADDNPELLQHFKKLLSKSPRHKTAEKLGEKKVVKEAPIKSLEVGKPGKL